MPHTNNSLFIRLAEGKELGLKLSQQSELKKGIDSYKTVSSYSRV